jgi:hypothetical protein
LPVSPECRKQRAEFRLADVRWREMKKETALKKLKPVATSVATGFCSPQNEIIVTRHSGGARVFLVFFADEEWPGDGARDGSGSHTQISCAWTFGEGTGVPPV